MDNTSCPSHHFWQQSSHNIQNPLTLCLLLKGVFISISRQNTFRKLYREKLSGVQASRLFRAREKYTEVLERQYHI